MTNVTISLSLDWDHDKYILAALDLLIESPTSDSDMPSKLINLKRSIEDQLRHQHNLRVHHMALKEHQND